MSAPTAVMAATPPPTLLVRAVAPPPAPPAGDEKAEKPEKPEEDEDFVIIDEEEMEGEKEAGEEGAPAEGEQPEAGASDLDLDLGGDVPAEEQFKLSAEEREKQLKSEEKLVSSVPRRVFLKAPKDENGKTKGRFELQPQFGISVNDPYVRHYTIGLGLRYWFHNKMGIGLTGTGFIGAKTPRYDNVRFQEGILLTANKILWQASVDFIGVPMYGKAAIFNRAIMHWDGFMGLGGGVMQTEVIPRYEALHEPFRTITGGGYFVIGAEFYIPKLQWFSFSFGVRTWFFPDKLEPTNRGPDTDPGGVDDPALDPPGAAKSASGFELAYNVLLYLGVSFYLPSRFEYSTPR
jgi:hypothetical protein